MASAKHQSAMADAVFSLNDKRPHVVGSFGGTRELRDAEPAALRERCELAEIRLDLIVADSGGMPPPPWRHLAGIPLLFTARRLEEGGALALKAAERMRLLENVLDEAACIDIELASIGEMEPLVKTLRSRGIPWIASFHDFSKLPDTAVMVNAARRARDAGAAVFKAAALLHSPADMARLADFQLADHGLPVATMGMGPLAAVSRLLCAQCGSALNYGYLGQTPTAPGQWDAGSLKQAISRLDRFDVRS